MLFICSRLEYIAYNQSCLFFLAQYDHQVMKSIDTKKKHLLIPILRHDFVFLDVKLRHIQKSEMKDKEREPLI